MTASKGIPVTNASSWYDDGRLHFGVGIEDTFIAHETIGRRKLDEYELTQHDLQWEHDFQLAADAGAEFLRWGVPWYRVEPRPGEFDWSWTDQVAAHAEKLGLAIIVDLMHYGTPLWLDNSFINTSYPEAVARYSRAVAERYAGTWNEFTTVNEPVWNAVICGERGTWPPYLTGQDGFVKVMTQIARGMVRAQQEIQTVNPAAQFINVEAGFLFSGPTVPLPIAEMEERRFLSLDLTMGRVTEGHPLRGFLASHGVADDELAWFRDNAVRPDVIGVNYYPAWTRMSFDEFGGEVPLDGGVEGFEEIIRLYFDRYGLPLAITETSRSESVEARVAWVRDSIATVQSLRNDGVPILAYTWFPFFALYDWAYRESTRPADEYLNPLGLYDLVRGADGKLERVATDAVAAFREITAQG